MTAQCGEVLARYIARSVEDFLSTMADPWVPTIDKGRYQMGILHLRSGLLLLAALLTVLFLGVETTAAHSGGRYGTVGDMESSLGRNSNVLMSVCNGLGTPRRNAYPKQFWGYKHFRCWVVTNSPYRQLCLTIHTLRSGRILITRSVRVQNPRPGDCG